MTRKLLVWCWSAFLLLSMYITASAVSPEEGVELQLPEEYIVITRSNASSYDDAAALLGFTAKSLKSHMQDNGILVLALTGNNTRQVQLRVSEGEKDSYTEKIEDLSLLNDEALQQTAGELVALLVDTQVENYSVEENTSGIKAIRIVTVTEDSATFQYITVRNGKVYSLVGHDAADSDGKFLGEIFETLSVKKQTSSFSVSDGAQVITASIILLLIAGAVFLIIRLILSFIRDFRNRENDVSDYIKIKRRKF